MKFAIYDIVVIETDFPFGAEGTFVRGDVGVIVEYDDEGNYAVMTQRERFSSECFYYNEDELRIAKHKEIENAFIKLLIND